MNPKQAYRQYQATCVNTSSPEGLIALLFKEGLRNMIDAKEALTERDNLKKRQCIVKAVEIISELRCCLNLEKGGAIGEQLAMLYEYVLMRLIESNLSDAPGPIDEAINLITTLNEGWGQICLSPPNNSEPTPITAGR